MSWAFITALKKNPQQSYVQLLNSIREELESKYTQKPQLSCSHPLGKCFGSVLASLPQDSMILFLVVEAPFYRFRTLAFEIRQ